MGFVHFPVYSDRTVWLGRESRPSTPDTLLFCNYTFGDVPDEPNADWIGEHDCTNLVTPTSEMTEFLSSGGINRTYETPTGTFTFNSKSDSHKKQNATLVFPVPEHEQPYNGNPMVAYAEAKCMQIASFDESGERF